jgi:N-acetylglucosaminyldiphosphoundecaprenol N-acetyl-beta-D-mannosaminyltransferase
MDRERVLVDRLWMMQPSHCGADLPQVISLAVVGGISISCADVETATEALIRGAISGHVHLVSAHGVVESQKNHDLRSVLNSGTALPDGTPLTWVAAATRQTTKFQRCYGPDLMRSVLDWGRRSSKSHFLVGGTDDTLPELVSAITSRWPGANVAGAMPLPFRPLTPTEFEHLTSHIGDAQPDFIWVGISTPKQDFLAAQITEATGRTCLAVGAAFDFIRGSQQGAPPALQRAGLEWLYRLSREPRRLWQRYSRVVPIFLMIGARQIVRARLKGSPSRGRPQSGQ